MQLLRTGWTAAVLAFALGCVSSAAAQSVLYVDDDASAGGDGTSWATAFEHLQDALAATEASGGTVTEIRVAQGTYKPDQGAGITPGDRDATFQLLDGLSLKGGYAGIGAPEPDARDIEAYETVLSGDLLGDDGEDFTNRWDNSYQILVADSAVLNAVIDGFAITRGNGDDGTGDLCSPWESGAGLANLGANLEVIDCTFLANRVSCRGAAILNEGGSARIEGCSFIGNYGWPVSNLSCDATLIDCSFVDNQEAALLNSSSNVSILSCTFDGNSGRYFTGAVYNHLSSPLIDDCLFNNNSTSCGIYDGCGAAIINRSSSPTVSNCTFTVNSSSGPGGAISNLGQSNSTVVDCEFTGNTADDGAAIYCNVVDPWEPPSPSLMMAGDNLGNPLSETPSLTLGGCTFSANISVYSDTATLESIDVPVDIDNCVFTDNGSGSRYAVRVSGANLSLTGCSFERNATAVSHESGVLDLSDCTFVNNAKAVGCSFVDATVADSSFSGHYFDCLHFYYGSINASRCTFTDNAGIEAGAIWAQNCSATTVSNSTFRRNRTEFSGAGALHVTGGTVEVADCQFLGNTGRYIGGVFISGCPSASFTNCSFVGNGSLSQQTGGLQANDSELNLRNCDIVANRGWGDGVGVRAFAGSTTVANCTLWRNEASGLSLADAQVYATPGTLAVSYSLIEGWTGELGGTGNFGADPFFVRNPSDGGDGWGDDPYTHDHDESANNDYGDLRRRLESPCLDAGDNTAVPPDTRDVDDDGDTTERVPWDIAGLARFNDDPATPDTGVADPPDYPLVVDIGAHEFDPLGDRDEDGVHNASDNCQAISNPDQSDGDADGVGDACDNCLAFANPDQADLNDDGVGDECQSRLYVDDDAPAGGDGTSWLTAFTHLQDALAAAEASGGLIDKILVARGTYRPDQGASVTPGDRSAVFVVKTDLSIKGGYAGLTASDPGARDIDAYKTVLSGDLDGKDEPGFVNYEDNSYTVVSVWNSSRDVVLEGITITGANSDGDSDLQIRGGGLYIAGGHPSGETRYLLHCQFVGNRAQYAGGAYIRSTIGVVIEQCVFAENLAYNGSGGGLYAYDSEGLVTDCTFRDNTGHWGGAASLSSDSQVVVSNSRFDDNRALAYDGGGLYLNAGTFNIFNCSFGGNRAGDQGGAIYSSNADTRLVNSSFAGNQAYYGGGLYALVKPVDLANCTFTSNHAERGGALVYDYADDPMTMANCILWANTALFGSQVALPEVDGGATLRVEHCDVQDGQAGVLVSNGSTLEWGAGNIDADPQFARLPDAGWDGWGAGDNDDFGDLRLRPGSPCLDAGDNDLVPADFADLDDDGDTVEPTPFDFDGRPRFADDPVAPDVGNAGTAGPPIVDMGAFEYQEDCNNNGMIDSVDLAPGGTSDDCDINGTPDECQPDADADTFIDPCDVCPAFADPDQVDTDGDGHGDPCDNCPEVPNPDQCDLDADGRGDACAETVPPVALQFDGLDDYATIPDAADYHFEDGDFAIEIWFRTTGPGFLLDKRVLSPPGELGCFLQIDNESRIAFALEIPAQEFDETAARSLPGFDDGQWHHAAGVREGDEIRIYVDGELEATEPLLPGMFVSNEQPIILGARHNLADFFGGRIDELRIWSTARTEQQIQASMYTTLQGNEPGLVGYWPFDAECSRQALIDASAHTADGWLGLAPTATDYRDPLRVLSHSPVAFTPDTDGDGVFDPLDNCPANPNADQTDTDTDGFGDACDNCPDHANADQADLDQDSTGDVCDDDEDGDDVPNEIDNCPRASNPDQADADDDDVGDVCDLCAETPFGFPADADGCPLAVPGDFDGDLDVDQDDWGEMQLCLTGAGVDLSDPLCEGALLDEDDDVDQDDVDLFIDCMSGARMLGDPTCAGGG